MSVTPGQDPVASAGYTAVPDDAGGAAARSWWDAHADEYLADHGASLGAADFVWGPEGLREEDACLLGTDAVREGVDVPGRSLRLVVFDRVPWPRPDILHKARRAHFGKRTYDDAVTRLRLKQAFGRLIRRDTDRGVFVLLDPMMPSRLKRAFPPDVPFMRVGLKEAIEEIRGFLSAEPRNS